MMLIASEVTEFYRSILSNVMHNSISFESNEKIGWLYQRMIFNKETTSIMKLLWV